MVNVDQLKQMTETPAPVYDMNARTYAVATNAAQEIRVAKGRGPQPFSDNDLKVILSIKGILDQIEGVSDVNPKNEHFPLVGQDSGYNSRLDKIHNLIENDLVQEVVDIREKAAGNKQAASK